LSDNAFHLVTLGRLALRTPAGTEDETQGTHRQKLALLAVLALSGRPLSRDQLIGMFWGDQTEARARHSLSNALSHLRRVLGRHAIRPHRDEVALEAGAPLTVDADEFARAVSRGAWEVAVSLYGGPFLDGVYVGGAPEFEQWVDGERARLEGLFLKACAARASELAAAGDRDATEALARRWLAVAPLSSEAAVLLLDTLTALGTRDADQRALDAYDKLVTRLGEDYGRRPAREVISRAQAIVERLRATDATGEYRVPEWVGQVAVDVADRQADDGEPPARPMAAARIWPRAVAVAAVLLIIGLMLFRGPWDRPSSTAPAPGDRPAVAIGAIRVPGDSATAWLSDGLMQMVSARLARSSAVEAVSPERMRELLPRSASLSQLLEAARRAGAEWAVSGSVTRAERAYVMDVNVHAVRDGRLVSLTTVTAADPIALADLIAVRVMAAAGSPPDGPSLAEVETASPDAYEAYIRFRRAQDEERMADAIAALDAAIALDSGFVSALRERASIAFPTGDARMLGALLTAFQRHEARATEFDRIFLASQSAFYGGEHERSEALARQLVDRYPRDPRAYSWLSEVYTSHGRLREAKAVLLRLLAMDSLATRSGAGACIPCFAYSRLADVHHALGDLAGSEAAARRYTELAPEITKGWLALSVALAAQGRYVEALAPMDSLVRIDPLNPGWAVQRARLLMMMRDWEAAEAAVRAMRQSPAPGMVVAALDMSATLARERGRYRASIAALDSTALFGPPILPQVAGNSRGRIGDRARVLDGYRTDPPPATLPAEPVVRAVSRIGDVTRGWSWHRALEADAIAPSGDTVRLRRIADSLEQLSGRSYYGRDWRLHHHVRGLLLAREGRHAEAVAEFRAAHWNEMGWSRSLAEQAKSELALGRAADALATLRRAYIVPLEAMGRYLPRTEIDLLMALAFRQAGQADSAGLYVRYVRTAFEGADPEAQRLLELLRGG
jgi:DNA-binding SARP family transcriptional activator/TolB-like protein